MCGFELSSSTPRIEADSVSMMISAASQAIAVAARSLISSSDAKLTPSNSQCSRLPKLMPKCRSVASVRCRMPGPPSRQLYTTPPWLTACPAHGSPVHTDFAKSKHTVLLPEPLAPYTMTTPALGSRPCKIHRNIQPSDPQRVLRACVAIASAAAQIHSRASRGAKSPLRPKRTIARSSQRML